MHDPMTVAFEIKSPFAKPLGATSTWYPPIVTIWHVDPSTGASDDSCDWFGRYYDPDEVMAEDGAISFELGQFGHIYERDGVSEHMQRQLMRRGWRLSREYHFKRPWWQHPKYHIWHWQIQIHPLQKLKRWLFSRCAHCGKRFPWGYSPISGNWKGDGPQWFKSERNVYHHECYNEMRRSVSGVTNAE